MKKKIYDIVFASQYEGLSTKEATDQLLVLFGVSNHVKCKHEKGRRSSVTSDYWKCSKCGETFKGN